MNYTLNLAPSECSMVANKPTGVQMYTVTGSKDHSVVVCSACCATDRKQFRIITHSHGSVRVF